MTTFRQLNMVSCTAYISQGRLVTYVNVIFGCNYVTSFLSFYVDQIGEEY